MEKNIHESNYCLPQVAWCRSIPSKPDDWPRAPVLFLAIHSNCAMLPLWFLHWLLCCFTAKSLIIFSTIEFKCPLSCENHKHFSAKALKRAIIKSLLMVDCNQGWSSPYRRMETKNLPFTFRFLFFILYGDFTNDS